MYILHYSSFLYRWANCSVGEEILKDLLPGPFTLIFERSSHLNPDLNPNVKSVGIRIPDCTVCSKLVSQLGAPIALTSANISGKSSAVSIDVSSLLVPDFQPFAQMIFKCFYNPCIHYHIEENFGGWKYWRIW